MLSFDIVLHIAVVRHNEDVLFYASNAKLPEEARSSEVLPGFQASGSPFVRRTQPTPAPIRDKVPGELSSE